MIKHTDTHIWNKWRTVDYIKIIHYDYSVSPGAYFPWILWHQKATWIVIFLDFLCLYITSLVFLHICNSLSLGLLYFRAPCGNLWHQSKAGCYLVCVCHSAYSLTSSDSGTADCQKAIIKFYWYNFGKNKELCRGTA